MPTPANPTKKLLKTLATEMEYALTVYEEACQCKTCGPCRRQRRIRGLITQARNAADEIPDADLGSLLYRQG